MSAFPCTLRNALYVVLALFIVDSIRSIMHLNIYAASTKHDTVNPAASPWDAMYPDPDISTNAKCSPPSNSVQLPKSKKVSKFLDFYIMGFPKCATSSLMQFFMKTVNETDIVWMDDGTQEYDIRSMKNVERLLEKIEEGRNTNPEVKKYGIKWPIGLYEKDVFVSSMKNLIESNPQHEETKFIVGMRHPVRFFESYWNYRELVHKDMPPPSTLIGSSEVGKRGVYTEIAQFEKGLMVLGKFDLVPDDFAWLGKNRKTVLPTKNKVFLYLQEQFEDQNATRFQKFLDDLLSFVGVEEARVTSDDFPSYNVINKKKKKAFDICDEAHKEVRNALVLGGKATAKWMETNLENSKDVFVSDKEYFLDMVKTWGQNPCV